MPVSVFDAVTTAQVLGASGLRLRAGITIKALSKRLNAVAQNHYWKMWEAVPTVAPHHRHWSVVDNSVTPSALRNRLMAIHRAARGFPWPRSRKSMQEKLDELLKRLGESPEGGALRYSGTEKAGGSERTAVRFYFRQAVQALERPPTGYQPPFGEPSWEHGRVMETVDAVVGLRQSGTLDLAKAIPAMQDIAGWAEWGATEVAALITDNMHRHQADQAWERTVADLGQVCEWASGRRPSHYETKNPTGADYHPTMKFLTQVVARIRAPEAPLQIETVRYLWSRVAALQKHI